MTVIIPGEPVRLRSLHITSNGNPCDLSAQTDGYLCAVAEATYDVGKAYPHPFEWVFVA
jgi:hypothetical protein